MKNKYGETLASEISRFFSTSKRKPLKLEPQREAELYNSIFQNFLKNTNIHHYPRFTGKGPIIAEKVIRTIRNLLKKLIFLAGNADWISELPSVTKK